MSVTTNTYVMLGCLFDLKTLRADHPDISDRLELYEDGTTDLIVHVGGVCCLYDGMNGDYVIIGKVIAKTGPENMFEKPVMIDPVPTSDFIVLRREIANLLPGSDIPPAQFLVVSHSR
jgi:hypothetical protein